MVEISARNFVDIGHIWTRDYVCRLLCRKVQKVMKGNKYGTCYLSGATYYFKPVNDGYVGFGSGILEVKFSPADDGDTIYQKLYNFRSSRYSSRVGYSSGEIGKKAIDEVNEFCKW